MMLRLEKKNELENSCYLFAIGCPGSGFGKTKANGLLTRQRLSRPNSTILQPGFVLFSVSEQPLTFIPPPPRSKSFGEFFLISVKTCRNGLKIAFFKFQLFCKAFSPNSFSKSKNRTGKKCILFFFGNRKKQGNQGRGQLKWKADCFPHPSFAQRFDPQAAIFVVA